MTNSQRFEVVRDEGAISLEILRAIVVVAKIERTSLRNALLEEIVGLLRKASRPYTQVYKDVAPSKGDNIWLG